jgi:hypothetical protein
LGCFETSGLDQKGYILKHLAQPYFGTKASPRSKTENAAFCRLLKDCFRKIPTVYFLYRLPIPAGRRWTNRSALRKGLGHPAVFFRGLLFDANVPSTANIPIYPTGSQVLCLVAQFHLKMNLRAWFKKGTMSEFLSRGTGTT